MGTKENILVSPGITIMAQKQQFRFLTKKKNTSVSQFSIRRLKVSLKVSALWNENFEDAVSKTPKPICFAQAKLYQECELRTVRPTTVAARDDDGR